MRIALVAVVLWSCGPAGITTYESGDGTTPRGTEPPPETSTTTEVVDVPVEDGCALSTRDECMASTECVLVLLGAEEPEPYACRPADGPCEERLAQGSQSFLDECRAREGCAATEARCYCGCEYDEPCDCECAGGPPPECS